MKVTIITACFNSSRTILDCINSVNEQTHTDIEHIIIDAASTDNTLQLINSIPNRVTNIVTEPDKGIYDAMNKGIVLASGDIIGILNSDDLYTDNEVIKKIVQIFENSSTDCVHANLYYVNKNNVDLIVRHWRTCDYIQGAFKKGWHPAHPTFFVRKEVYERFGLFNLNFNLAADFELMLRFLEHYKIKSTYLPQFIVRMRLGGATSKNIKNIIEQNIECYKAFKINKIKVSPLYSYYRLFPKLKQFLNE